jgi:hypothetical protein
VGRSVWQEASRPEELPLPPPPAWGEAGRQDALGDLLPFASASPARLNAQAPAWGDAGDQSDAWGDVGRSAWHDAPSNSERLPPQQEAWAPRQPSQQAPVIPAHAADEGKIWNCSECTYENHSALTKCEICETPRGQEVELEAPLHQPRFLDPFYVQPAASVAAPRTPFASPPPAFNAFSPGSLGMGFGFAHGFAPPSPPPRPGAPTPIRAKSPVQVQNDWGWGEASLAPQASLFAQPATANHLGASSSFAQPFGAQASLQLPPRPIARLPSPPPQAKPLTLASFLASLVRIPFFHGALLSSTDVFPLYCRSWKRSCPC